MSLRVQRKSECRGALRVQSLGEYVRSWCSEAPKVSGLPKTNVLVCTLFSMRKSALRKDAAHTVSLLQLLARPVTCSSRALRESRLCYCKSPEEEAKGASRKMYLTRFA